MHVPPPPYTGPRVQNAIDAIEAINRALTNSVLTADLDYKASLIKASIAAANYITAALSA